MYPSVRLDMPPGADHGGMWVQGIYVPLLAAGSDRDGNLKVIIPAHLVAKERAHEQPRHKPSNAE